VTSWPRRGGVLQLVGVLEFGGRNVAAGLEQTPLVEPVDVVESGELDLPGGSPRAAGLISLVLYRPITDSARALS
jgi:hypothetical protein